MSNNVFSGSIHTLYIYPEYRRKHIASFLINNLNKLLNHYLAINVRCLTTYVNPYHNDIPGKYALTGDVEVSTKDKEMVNVILKLLKKLGFKKVRGFDNTYIVDLFEMD